MRKNKTPKTEQELISSFMAEQTREVILYIDILTRPFSRAAVQRGMGIPRGSVTRPISNLIDYGAVEELDDQWLHYNRKATQRLWLANMATREQTRSDAGLSVEPRPSILTFDYPNKGKKAQSAQGTSRTLIKSARWSEVVGLVKAYGSYHENNRMVLGKQVRS